MALLASAWLLLLPPRPTAAIAAEAKWEAVPVLKDLLPSMECDTAPPPVKTPVKTSLDYIGSMMSTV